MPESSEGQQPSPVEQGNARPRAKEFRHESVQIPSTEPRPETSLNKLERGDVIGYMDEENKQYLRENAETPEIAEQLIEVYENAKKCQETVAKFSKDDPNTPASEETKQKLIDLTDVNDKDGSLSRKAHMYATVSIVTSIFGGASMEFVNYINGSAAPPGVLAEVGLATGAALSGSIEGYALAKKGVEKLKALIGKNKPTGAEAPQSSRIQTRDNKI